MRKSGLTGDEAYALSKRRGTTEDLGPLKKEIGLLKEDLGNLSSSKISKFYATNNGENHLADSDDGKIADMMVYGKSEQKSTMGKNLLKLSEANAQGNENGLSATMNADGSISVTGASTSTWSNIIKINNECHTDNATYTFSVDKNSGIIIGLKLGRTKLDDANYQTHRIMQNQLSCTFETGASNEYCSLFLEGLTVGKSYNFTIYPMLELGTEATAYEPYTGGQPSPSPDYPQEIKSVVNPIVKVCGKNLLQPNIKFNDRVKINIKEGTRLTLICKNGVVSQGGNLRFETADGGVEWFGFDAGAVKQQTVLRNNVVSLQYLLHYESSESYALYIGDENTYEPYKEQSVQLPYTLNAIPVSSGGNVTINGQQYIADYVDVERGKVVRMCERETFNTKNGKINEEYRLALDTGALAKDDGSKECIFSAFKYVEWETCTVGTMIYIKNIKKPNNELYTAQELKELSLDFDVVYQLLEQQETDLTTEQTQALKELVTYYPVTNISINSEQLDGYTVFNYPVSMANGWNYVKQQLNDNRDYIYDMDTKTQDIDTQAAEAYVNSEYAVALTELEV